ncbi:MAG TPA: hypothetical protein VE377_06415 [Candidatus Dormibacteraeota bacterium]|nr:hypothetical protein [Candidatus Dormibacteraeota bacterium]
MKYPAIVFALLSASLSAAALAQTDSSQASSDDFISNWFQRSSRTESEQPHWAAPMFTVTPRLVQQFRYDMGWQSNKGFMNANYGSSKGFELIPVDRIELYVSAPPYLTHTKPGLNNGIGDMTFLFKYRAAAGNPENGNYVVTAMLLATVPTGTYSNGATDASVSPTLALGKGWRNFDLQGTAGVTVPTGDRNVLGTPVGLNVTAQYHLLRYFWPELEVNSTMWANGKNDGKKQAFVSPGLVVGKVHLWKRIGFAFGGGVQIAATQFHAYEHNWVTSVRLPF